MLSRLSLRCWRFSFIGFVFLSFTISAFAWQQQSESPRSEKRHRFQMPLSALEIISPHKSAPLFKGRAGTFEFFLDRDSLSIVNREAAKDFTAVNIEVSVEKEALKVRLSIIYNDLSDREWWKNKKEKEVGNFTIPVGNSLSPSELLQFGIEPFEIRAVSNQPVVLKPEEYPRILNLTNSIEVVEVGKSIEGYRFLFKNNSNKNVVAFEIGSRNSGISSDSSRTSSKDSLIPSGEIYEKGYSFAGADIEQAGLTIKMVLFSDGTFEGDAKSATSYLARWEGEAVQAAKLLPEIVQALNVADEELLEVFVKLEAQLWKMQEAMDKPSALEFLKIKYPSFDEEMISMLYEEFKSGFYSARNSALRPMGQSKQQLQERGKEFPETDKIPMLRRTLTQVKNTLEKIASASN
jgi:hypothetical protein